MDGKLSHHIEIKKRSCKLKEYGQTKVPLRKHSTAEHYFNHDKIKTYFVCEFTDCVGVLRLWEEPDHIGTMIARPDRGEDTDIYAFYNVDRFYVII